MRGPDRARQLRRAHTVVLLAALAGSLLAACGRSGDNGEAGAPRSTSASPIPSLVCRAPLSSWPTAALVTQELMVVAPFSDPARADPMAAAGAGAVVFLGQPPAGSGPEVTDGIAGVLAASESDVGHVAPWAATDEEGGPVSRLAAVVPPLPSARAMAARWSPARIEAAAAAHATALRALGITMDLAPVLDTAPPGDPVSDEADRSFSADPATAAAAGIAFARGLESAGVVPVAKHFPGLGHADADTDAGPATDPPLDQLAGADLVPFRRAVAAGIPVVMVGHPVVPGLTGSLPASLAPATYALLRHDGFRGVAVTDALAAGAIAATGDPEATAAVAALTAGADMAMVDASSWSAAVTALEQAVARGSLPVAQLRASVGRILAAKGIVLCPGLHR